MQYFDYCEHDYKIYNDGLKTFDAEPEFQSLKFNRNYIFPLGLLRLFAIILCLGGLIAALIIPFNKVLFYSSAFNIGFITTRNALIIFFLVFFLVNLVIFAMSISNFVNLPGIPSVIFLISFIGLDAVGSIIFISLGITAAVREIQASPLGFLIGYLIGTFAACSAFAFLTAVMQIASILYSLNILDVRQYLKRLIC